MGVALNGVVFDEELDPLVETAGSAGGDDRLAGGDLGRIGRCQTHQVIGARRIGAAVAVGAVRQPVAIVVLVVSAFRFRLDGTIGPCPSGRALAAELLLVVVNSGHLSALQANTAIVATVTRTSI